jgi:hypothetical protein
MVGALLALTASTALAQGISLSWNLCTAGGGVANRASTCLVTTGANTMISSFYSPVSITALESMEGYVDYQSGVGISCWWDLRASNAPRAASLSVLLAAPGDINGDPTWACASNYWFDKGGLVGGGGSMSVIGNGNGRISCVAGVPQGSGSLPAAGEQAAFGIRFNNANAPVANGCLGCLSPACFTLNRVTLYNAGSPIGVELNTAVTRNSVTWQGGAIGGPGCPAATPTQNKTWGSVKALYR